MKLCLKHASMLALFIMSSGASAQKIHKNLNIPENFLLGDLEMTGPEYRKIWEQNNFLISGSDDESDPLRAILEIGKRNLDWLSFINSRRDSQNRLELSTPATQQGIPITSPRISNRSIIADGWEGLKDTLSTVVYDVLINNKPFTADLGVSDEQFLTEIRNIDQYYQRSSRWLLQEPYLEMYARESVYDVRGYYFLQQEPELKAKLQTFDTLPEGKQNELKTWLVMECVNATQVKSTCESDFNRATRSHKLLEYHQQYEILAQDMWDSFFRIDAFREDVTWTSQQPNVMTIPFRDPHVAAVSAWLRDNIQDEFQWAGWTLKLDFQPNGDDSMTHIVFKDGATPHVNELAGSEITMDGNRNIDEYSSRWTIRHEYGHVLGLPDCYVEFYDQEAGVMINYQLDITNLMCSRRGKLQQKHFDELTRVYFQP